MSEKAEKPSIPAWQQAAKSTQAEEPTPGPSIDNKDAEAATTSPDIAAGVEPTPFRPVVNEQDQREQIRAFLKDAVVKDQSDEKKRAFLKSKDMPEKLIDEELDASRTSLNAGDFAQFQGQASQGQSEAIVQAPPPIITYPEFLANAHTAPPLLTPTRILATAYVASATAVLAYAASTFIIKPMTAALTDARHELATHSVSKLDELSNRLEKLVSQVPGAKEGDSDSEIGEPTELFSRDQGTQTADAVAQPDGHSSKVTILEPNATTKQAEKLSSLQKHLEELVAGSQKGGKAVEEREANVKSLRHYLDSLSYGSGLNVWSNAGGQFGWEQTAKDQQKEKEKKDDAIEDLKKEIRGVKGVLLSAKRFPAAGRQSPAPASQYSVR